MAVTLALLTCTALALSFASTRGIGILGTGILILLLHPAIRLVALFLAGLAAYAFHHHH